jgi:hypothetical protein
MIAQTTPLNGVTAVDVAVQPSVVVGQGASVVAKAGDKDYKIYLRDMTGGGARIEATLEIAGAKVTYQPKAPLAAAHVFELVFEEGAIVGEGLDEIDASETPSEPLARWPFRLWFATRAQPRVRAAYLDRHDQRPMITIAFSQPMEPSTTAKAVSVQDLAGKAIGSEGPAWVDTQTLRVELTQALDVAVPYRLVVGAGARSDTDIALDGNDDGTPGDAFTASFTGSQPIIFSRHPQ